MTEQRALYRKLVARARRALLDGDPGVIPAVEALYRGFGWLGKTKAEIARDVGLSRRHYADLMHGHDDPDAPPRAPARPEGVSIIDVGMTLERGELPRRRASK